MNHVGFLKARKLYTVHGLMVTGLPPCPMSAPLIMEIMSSLAMDHNYDEAMPHVMALDLSHNITPCETPTMHGT